MSPTRVRYDTMLAKYDFEEKCRGGWIRAVRVQHGDVAIRIEPDFGMAWDGSLQRLEATAIADTLEGRKSSTTPIRIGLEEVSVRRTVFGAEISVAGVMVHSKVDVQLDHRQSSGLAKYLRPPPPPARADMERGSRRSSGQADERHIRMTVVKALSGIAAVIFWTVVVVPLCIVVFNLVDFRPVWDG